MSLDVILFAPCPAAQVRRRARAGEVVALGNAPSASMPLGARGLIALGIAMPRGGQANRAGSGFNGRKG